MLKDACLILLLVLGATGVQANSDFVAFLRIDSPASVKEELRGAHNLEQTAKKMGLVVVADEKVTFVFDPMHVSTRLHRDHVLLAGLAGRMTSGVTDLGSLAPEEAEAVRNVVGRVSPGLAAEMDGGFQLGFSATAIVTLESRGKKVIMADHPPDNGRVKDLSTPKNDRVPPTPFLPLQKNAGDEESVLVVFSQSKPGSWKLEMHARALEVLGKLRERAQSELRATAEEALNKLFAEASEHYGVGDESGLSGAMQARAEARMIERFAHYGFSTQEEALQFFHSAVPQVRRSITMQWVETKSGKPTFMNMSFVSF
jgi:hypothetical protein